MLQDAMYLKIYYLLNPKQFKEYNAHIAFFGEQLAEICAAHRVSGSGYNASW